MNRCTALMITVLVSLVLVLSCSGGSDNAVTPPAGSDLTPQISGQGPQTHLWGYWDVYIDVENQTVEAVLNRNAMFTANLTGILNSMPGALGFSFHGTTVGPGYVDVDLDVNVSHPLPGKPKFNGYDVRGIFMGNGSAAMNYNPDLLYAVPGLDQMMMADPVDTFGGPDGYTRWFNLTEFSEGGLPLLQYIPGAYASKSYDGTATLNPYKYFADTLGATDDLWTWLNDNVAASGVFSSGALNSRNYYIRFPTTVGIKFGYAVIANWEGGQPQHHPSNTPESVGCDVVDASDVWYVDPVSWGGNLNLDVSLFGWHGQPSAIYIESTVLAAAYELSAAEMTPTGGTEHYSTYHVEITADTVTGFDDQEFWVISEHRNYDYTNEFSVPNLADTDYLAAFFRYGLTIGDEPVCPIPIVIGIDPAVVNPGTVVTVIIECDEITDGPFLAATLVMAGEPNIDGTNVTWIDITHLSADFDLGGAALGYWTVIVTNGCGGLGGIGPDFLSITDCLPPTGCVIDIECGMAGDLINDANIMCDGLEDGVCLGASLTMDGQPDIAGTDVTFLSATEITVDFDLTGAKPGWWDLEVTSGCCGPPGVLEEAFLVALNPADLAILALGNLPNPLPTPDLENLDFCVQGDGSEGFEGVYYHYTTFAEDEYLIYFYPLDYSADGSILYTIWDPFGSDPDGLFGGGQYMAAIEVTPDGSVVWTSNWTGAMWWDALPGNGPFWWTNATDMGEISNGYIYYDMQSMDLETEFGEDPSVWGFWGIEVDIALDGPHYRLDSPYGDSDFTGLDEYYPIDFVGSVDSEVSHIDTTKLAVDNDPIVLDPPYDLVFYYMEGPPDDTGIEIFYNERELANPNYIGTIDSELVGTAVDICVLETTGLIGCSGNLLCVLEDNGDSTWQVAMFDMFGTLMARLPVPMPGDAIALDCDNEKRQIHVWSDVTGILTYTILGYM